jgi:hypothetical protein
MTDRSYTTTLTLALPPREVYDAVLDVRSWWTGEVEGPTDEVGAQFTYRHPPAHHSVQQVTDLDPGRRIAWRVIESHLSFASEPEEWTGTEISFDLRPVVGGTELTFRHEGLVPDVECYGACSAGWSHYVGGSLRERITTGTGLPDPW